MKDFSESVERQFSEWNKKYEIPEHMEFQIKTMFELQEEYRSIPVEYTKRKRDVLEMIMKLQDKLPTKLPEKISEKLKSVRFKDKRVEEWAKHVKPKEKDNAEKLQVFIKTTKTSPITKIGQLFEEMIHRGLINRDLIISIKKGNDYFQLETSDLVITFALEEKDSERGIFYSFKMI